MNFGAMTWACLVLAAAGQPEEWPTNQRSFQIPIRFDPQKRAEIEELDLYVSHDKGQTWNLAARATPDKEYFPYAVTEDGPYWFTMAVIDKKKRQDPPNIMTAPVGQRMVVDTVRPDIQLKAERQGNLVAVDWAITEEHPNPDTLRLQYGDTAQGPWTDVHINPGATGHAEIQNPGAMVVRMQMEDRAGNQGTAVKPVAANAASALTPPPPPSFDPAPPPPTPVSVAPPAPPVPDASREVPHWLNHSTDDASHLPPPPPPGPAVTPVSDVPPPLPPPAPTPGPVPAPAPAPQAATPKASGPQVVASFSPNGAGPGTPLGPDAPAPASGELPPLQIVSKRQMKLEFDVGKFGPSGLGGVDVYVTMDDGATWQPYTVDPKATVLPPTDARSGEPVRGSVTVQVQNEGVTYGFYLVVKNRAGLGKPAPRNGDAPQLRVELDCTPPKARLWEPKADPERRDTLTLTWEATDKHLTATPITLEWSAQVGPEAQWNPIGPPELANDGHFDWQPGADVPPNVYLRMTVRDTAGNRSVAQTPKPVLIDLSIPEVSNIGLAGFNPPPPPLAPH